MIATGVSSWVYADRSPRQQWGGPVDALIFGKMSGIKIQSTLSTKEKRKMQFPLGEKDTEGSFRREIRTGGNLP
jgi:hypothetical protein